MTLDEAIKHVREVAEENREEAMNAFFPPYADECESCAEEHEQLVSWLEELKELREFKTTYQKGMDYSYATFMYNKAIDDFIKKLEEHEHKNWIDNLEYGITWSDIEQITEELKEHKTLNIVHCKDCKHWGTGVPGETENVKCCEYGKYMVGKHGFCCYAEKECAE